MKHITKLLLVSSVTALSTFTFCGIRVYGEAGSAKDASELSDLVGYLGSCSELVHEVQIERGLSAGYLSSGGKKFGAKLELQREATDRATKSVEKASVMLVAPWAIEFAGRIRSTLGDAKGLRAKITEVPGPPTASMLTTFFRAPVALTATFFVATALPAQQQFLPIGAQIMDGSQNMVTVNLGFPFVMPGGTTVTAVDVDEHGRIVEVGADASDPSETTTTMAAIPGASISCLGTRSPTPTTPRSGSLRTAILLR